MKFLTAIDMLKNVIRNAVVHPLAAAPAQPVVGQIYFDTVMNRLQVFNGASFGLTADSTLSLNGQNAAFYLNRANHTGTQTAATISNLAATVKAYTLSDFALPAANLNLNAKRITNLADPISQQDAATMGWVTAQVQSAAAGIDSKASVRALSNENIALSGFLTVDGVPLAAGDRVLVRAQSTPAQNGVYTVASGAWPRAADADQTNELTAGAFWFVEEGETYAKTQWRLETTGQIAVGSTAISINQYGAVASGYTAGMGVDITGTSISVELSTDSGLTFNGNGIAVDKAVFAQKVPFTIGDGSAVSYVVTHNLGTKDVSVDLRLADTGEWVMADWIATDADSVTIEFATAPAANAIKGVIIG